MLTRFNAGVQSLLRNKIEGVTKGFLVYLRIQGIGYRATLKDQTLQFKLGYSHDITYELPPAMRAFLPEPTLVGLYGIDKNQVRTAVACVMRWRRDASHRQTGVYIAPLAALCACLMHSTLSALSDPCTCTSNASNAAATKILARCIFTTLSPLGRGLVSSFRDSS